MIIRTLGELNLAVNMLKKSLTWTYDIETNGLDTRNGEVIGFGCTNPDTLEGFYIILKEFVNGELVELISYNHVRYVLEILQSKRLLTFNGSFDTRFTLNVMGVNLIDSIHADIMLLKHTCDEEQPFRLKDIGALLFGDEAKDAQKDMLESIKANGGSEKEYYKADSAIMAKYGLQDGILTAKVYNHYMPILKKEGLYKFFFEDEVMPLYRLVTIPMELKGIPLNTPLLQQTKEEINKDLEQLEDSIQAQLAPLLDDFTSWYLNKEYPIELSGSFMATLGKLIAPANWPLTKAGTASFAATTFKKFPELKETDLYKYQSGQERIPATLVKQVREELLKQSGTKYIFNISSKDHLKRLFFEKLKETPTSKTDKGNPQVENDFLELMADKYVWASQITTYNKLIKLRGTYVEGYLDKQENGIFYPSFFQHRTVSGRFGSNIQQLPRAIEGDDIVAKYTNRVRQFFISGEGYAFVDADYESLEPHVFAHVSGDQGLKDIFINGHDFYSTIAIATEGLTQYSADKKAPNYLGKMNKDKRQTAKAYSLGTPYGLGGYALSMQLKDAGMNISDKEAQALINRYVDAYPNLKKWMKESDEFAAKNGYMKTESGRIRRFPGLVELIKKHNGIDMTNHLEIWKKYHDSVSQYAEAKEDGKYIRNCLNNSKNVQIQGLGASIVNRASIALAIRLKQINKNAYICAQIHDEILVRSPNEAVEAVKEAVKDCLENTYKISLKLKAEPSIGSNFSEAKG